MHATQHLKDYAALMLVSIFAVLAPIQAVIIAAFVLTLADMVLGVLAAIKRKESINSSGFRRTISKLMVYESAIILGFIGETYLLGQILPVSKMVSTFVGVTELKSILENLGDIYGKPILPSVITALTSTLPKPPNTP